jgi:hypothetical protein
MAGGVWSALTTLNVQVDAFPAASVAVSVTVVVPVPDTTVPAVGLCVMVIDPGAVQLSLTTAKAV